MIGNTLKKTFTNLLSGTEKFLAAIISASMERISPKNIINIEITFDIGGRWKNRTPTNGFGDRCSTIKLIAHRRKYTHFAFIFNENPPHKRGVSLFFRFFMNSFFLAPLAILFKLDLACDEFLVFA